MAYKIAQDGGEIDELHDECVHAESLGETKYPGMTYEQGVLAAIRWLTDADADHPLKDEEV
jgi:hypothetical protein